MELQNLGERLAHLRISKNVSAREMSFSIGMSANYINKIENGKSLPSMAVFFDICDYLNISQKEFFDLENDDPDQVTDMVSGYKRLDREARETVAGVVKVLQRKTT
ncbi:MAG: helix-turn-helix domain-containing protein [Oscillospiraceae bacterium]|nr:helix-turn-helix domain-containing protein [Oscillospiraceae bacterium]